MSGSRMMFVMYEDSILRLYLLQYKCFKLIYHFIEEEFLIAVAWQRIIHKATEKCHVTAKWGILRT